MARAKSQSNVKQNLQTSVRETNRNVTFGDTQINKRTFHQSLESQSP